MTACIADYLRRIHQNGSLATADVLRALEQADHDMDSLVRVGPNDGLRSTVRIASDNIVNPSNLVTSHKNVLNAIRGLLEGDESCEDSQCRTIIRSLQAHESTIGGFVLAHPDLGANTLRERWAALVASVDRLNEIYEAFQAGSESSRMTRRIGSRSEQGPEGGIEL